MANSSVFTRKSKTKPTTTINNAGGVAYALTDKDALGKVLATSCFGDSYYESADKQLDTLVQLFDKNDPDFIAKVALWAKSRHNMKDTPMVALVYLASIRYSRFEELFTKLIVSGKDLTNFVQVARSGSVNNYTTNLSSRRIQRCIRNWFKNADPERFVNHFVGKSGDFSLVDVVKMSRISPNDTEFPIATRASLKHFVKPDSLSTKEKNQLPQSIKVKKSVESGDMTAILDLEEGSTLDIRLLMNSVKTPADMEVVVQKIGIKALLKNLNTITRHGGMTPKTLDYIVTTLTNAELVRSARLMPYEIYAAWKFVESNDPSIRYALTKCIEIACENVPVLKGRTLIAMDTSGSMDSSVTGNRAVASKISCREASALLAGIIRYKNEATVFGFDTQVHSIIEPHEHRVSVMQLVDMVSQWQQGGTTVSSALATANARGDKFDNVIIISDNESWNEISYRNSGTGLMNEWATFKKRNPNARMVLNDITPCTSTQGDLSQKGIVLIPGFSTAVVDQIAKFFSREVPNVIAEIDQIKF